MSAIPPHPLMIESLQAFVDRRAPLHPALPLVHTKDFRDYERQRGDVTLQPHRCDVFDEALTYLFYGRPSYRPNLGRGSASQRHTALVCYVLKPEAVALVKRLFPFDTGAFSRHLYLHALGKSMNLNDFALPARLDSAQKVVAAFFEDNASYLLATPAELDLSQTDSICQAYADLIGNKSASQVDDRCSAVEVQTDTAIALRENLLAIVAPNQEAIALSYHRATIPWLGPDVEILPYFLVGMSNPSDILGGMRQVALQWLMARYSP